MGHKVHPYGFRIGIIKPWLAKWYADRDYANAPPGGHADPGARLHAAVDASVSQVEIERRHQPCHGHRSHRQAGHRHRQGRRERRGAAHEHRQADRQEGQARDQGDPASQSSTACSWRQNVAGQLERRIAFRKAIKQSIQRTIKAGAKGVKIQVSGRLGGSEMSRTEWDKEGRIPLGTLRADISYGVVHAHTTYGRIGVKAWVYRGEQLGDRPGSARTEPALHAATRPRRAPARRVARRPTVLPSRPRRRRPPPRPCWTSR